MSVIGALIIGGGAIAGGLISANASKSAARSAQQAASDNNALARDIYQKNTANEQPFLNSGTHANSMIDGLLYGRNTPAGQNAFNDYLDSTGYQFQYDEGQRALDHQLAAGGRMFSGGALKAGQRYGQQMGASAFQSYLNNLYNQQGLGLSAANALAGVGTNYVGQVSGNNNSAASAQANSALAGAANTNNLISQGLNAFGNIYGQGNNGTPFGSTYGKGSGAIIDDWSGAVPPY